METSKEEFQSFNEELETVNTELNRKVSELDQANSDLLNLLESTQIATIFLDSELRIKSFTPAAIVMFRLIAADVGRPITDLAARFADGDLAQDIKDVLKTLSTRERLLVGEGCRHYQMRILPYRTVHNVIDGVVITFTDVTHLKESEQRAREAEQRALDAKLYAENIVQTVREPLLVLDADLHVHSANGSFYETFRVAAEETEGRLLYELGNRDWDIPDLRRLLADLLPQKGTLEDFQVDHEFNRIGRRTMLLNARIVQQQNGATPLILLAIEDISRRAAVEQSREQELGRTKEELEALTSSLMKAQEEERRRIARDLHDDLAQQLALLEVEIETLQQKPPEDAMETARRLEPIQRRVSVLSDEVRALSHQLHPSILEDLGLEAALRSLVEEFERVRNSAVHLAFEGLRQTVPLPIATALYRIVQEALRNTAKHAPDSLINILVTKTSEAVQLLIKDTGPGFDLGAARAKEGLGIVSMQERARQLGGNLEIQSIPGRGTQITVAVPWSEGGIVNRWRLIVDNDASIRQMLRQLIQAIDGEVIGEAEDGAAGITATEHLQPDILLLDVSMPVMGGFEAACQLRSDRALIIQAAGCKVSPAAYREPPTIRSQRSQREAREEQ